MDKIDMHVHTTASDGTMRPEHVVSLAAMQGLKAIAITDHDTMDGIVEAGKAGELMGVTIIPGIELSTDYQGKEVHVLGYFLDENAPALKEYQSWAAEKRQERNEKILERLRKKGFEITMEQLKEANPDAVIGRPHIARKLVELGARFRGVPAVSVRGTQLLCGPGAHWFYGCGTAHQALQRRGGAGPSPPVRL